MGKWVCQMSTLRLFCKLDYKVGKQTIKFCRRSLCMVPLEKLFTKVSKKSFQIRHTLEWGSIRSYFKKLASICNFNYKILKVFFSSNGIRFKISFKQKILNFHLSKKCKKCLNLFKNKDNCSLTRPNLTQSHPFLCIFQTQDSIEFFINLPEMANKCINFLINCN